MCSQPFNALTHITQSTKIISIFIHYRPLVPYVRNFFCVILFVKCPLDVPLCNSFITLCAFVVDKHRLNLLSCPIMYKTSFFIVKGLTFLANYCFVMLTKILPPFMSTKNSYHSPIFILQKTCWHMWSILALLWVLWSHVI
jgi:hypothetical protein